MTPRFCFVLCAVLAATHGWGEEPAPARKIEPRFVLDNRYAAAVRSVSFSRDGKRLAAVGDSTSLNVWDVASGKMLLKPINFPAADRSDHQSVTFSPDGKVLVVGDIDSTIRFLDVDKRQVDTLKDRGRAVVFSPDGKSFAACGAASVKVWDAATRKELTTLKVPDGREATCVAYAPNGRFLVFGTEEGKVYGRLTDDFDKPPFLILRTPSKKQVSNNAIAAVVITDDSKLLAAVGRNRIISVWDTNGKKLYAIDGDLCVFTADSRFLLLSRSDGFTVYDAATGVKRTEVETSVLGGRHTVAVSPDGKTLAVGYDDGAVRVWDVKELLTGVK